MKTRNIARSSVSFSLENETEELQPLSPRRCKDESGSGGGGMRRGGSRLHRVGDIGKEEREIERNWKERSAS